MGLLASKCTHTGCLQPLDMSIGLVTNSLSTATTQITNSARLQC